MRQSSIATIFDCFVAKASDGRIRARNDESMFGQAFNEKDLTGLSGLFGNCIPQRIGIGIQFQAAGLAFEVVPATFSDGDVAGFPASENKALKREGRSPAIRFARRWASASFSIWLSLA
ncbi:MAG TPA: hypothetical protein VI451_08855 [Anaerolineales bacterium]|nr:hypothetical protein [Anaerolineales bacterium]